MLMTGPMVISACPASDELAQFQRGNLPSGKLEELAVHLESCSACQASLDSLPSVADELLVDLREIRDIDAPEDDSLIAEVAALESISARLFDDTREMRPAMPAAPELPSRISEYAVQGAIGRGGMGAVYRAVHTRLDKVVAIKVLSSQRLGDAVAVARFERETRAIGKLSHPHIVAATDAGEVAGAPFLVMEFVDGIDLAQLVKRQGPLSVADACEIVRQAALGLQYAHSHGLVHRDVKPSNLLLTSAPDQAAGGLVKVADLGLALLHEPDAGAGPNAETSGTTSANLVIGSLDYMAPEQADDAHQVDQRADLYSLGCTLYEFLAGKPPFASPSQTRLQKLKAHADAPAPSLAGACPKLPVGLESLVRKLLAKNPADRFASAASLATA